jgi:hypothetical protein
MGQARALSVGVSAPGADRQDGDRRAAGLQVIRAVGLSGVVRPASAHTTDELGAERALPVLAELRGLLPGGTLRRGATVVVRSPSVLLALLVAASRAGSWCAVVGMPTLSPVAAAEMGIPLERLALVPNPGAEWTTTVAALLDGLDIVVAAPPGPVAATVTSRLAARARQRGSVLIPTGAWSGADLTVEAVRGVWAGLGTGRGRLRCRELTIRAHGRGAAAVPREVTLWLPAPTGPFPPPPAYTGPAITGPTPIAPFDRPRIAAAGPAPAPAAADEPAARVAPVREDHVREDHVREDHVREDNVRPLRKAS